jgi:hypothetical protein
MSKSLKFENGDIVRNFNNSGYTYVEDNAKLQQDVKRILTTNIRKTTGLGCSLDEVLGNDIFSASEDFSTYPAVFEFQNRLRSGINNLKNAQRKYLFAQRTSKELIHDFSPAIVWATAEDPRNFKWRIDIVTQDGNGNFSINGYFSS